MEIKDEVATEDDNFKFCISCKDMLKYANCIVLKVDSFQFYEL